MKETAKIFGILCAMAAAAVLFILSASSVSAAEYTASGKEISLEGFTAAAAAGDAAGVREILDAQTRSFTWDGAVLSKKSGVNYGPNGKEVYYNMDMSVCVSNLQAMGLDGEYWVRADGCKMFGSYIMGAANLTERPKGTIIETSLGTAIVADTGGFAAGNPTMMDIAVSW